MVPDSEEIDLSGLTKKEQANIHLLWKVCPRSETDVMDLTEIAQKEGFTPKKFLEKAIKRAIETEIELNPQDSDLESIRRIKQIQNEIRKLDWRKKENQEIVVDKLLEIAKINDCLVCDSFRFVCADIQQYYLMSKQEREKEAKFKSL